MVSSREPQAEVQSMWLWRMGLQEHCRAPPSSMSELRVNRRDTREVITVNIASPYCNARWRTACKLWRAPRTIEPLLAEEAILPRQSSPSRACHAATPRPSVGTPPALSHARTPRLKPLLCMKPICLTPGTGQVGGSEIYRQECVHKPKRVAIWA